VFVAAKAVDVGGKHVVDGREAVEVGACVAIGAHTAGKEETKVGAGDAVCPGIPRVFCNVAACFGVLLGGKGVVVAAGPFRVPDVVGVARLFGGLVGKFLCFCLFASGSSLLGLCDLFCAFCNGGQSHGGLGVGHRFGRRCFSITIHKEDPI